jgi:hypothetical protein
VELIIVNDVAGVLETPKRTFVTVVVLKGVPVPVMVILLPVYPDEVAVLIIGLYVKLRGVD